MAAIALWMLALAVLGVIGVLTHRYPTPVLAVCTLFAAAGLGMIQRRRWGWALTLGAVFCSMCFACYMLFRFRQAPWAFTAFVNLIFFLYLVRSEVIGRLR
jgi:hypothetical protein